MWVCGKVWVELRKCWGVCMCVCEGESRESVELSGESREEGGGGVCV